MEATVKKDPGGRPSVTEKAMSRRVYFGLRVAKIRQVAGISQGELANLIDVSRQTVVKWETALRPVPVEAIWDMAIALGVTVPYLMGVMPRATEQLALVFSADEKAA